MNGNIENVQQSDFGESGTDITKITQLQARFVIHTLENWSFVRR
jgi:hypothetical protein